MRARDIMTAHPRTVLPGDPVRRAAEIMRELNIGAVPVVDTSSSRRLRGIITDRDITIRCTAEGHDTGCAVTDHMTLMPLQTALPDDDVHGVLEKMERAQVRRIPVVTEDGVLTGVIAQADVATRLGPSEPRVVEEMLERVSAPAVPVHA